MALYGNFTETFNEDLLNDISSEAMEITDDILKNPVIFFIDHIVVKNVCHGTETSIAIYGGNSFC